MNGPANHAVLRVTAAKGRLTIVVPPEPERGTALFFAYGAIALLFVTIGFASINLASNRAPLWMFAVSLAAAAVILGGLGLHWLALSEGTELVFTVKTIERRTLRRAIPTNPREYAGPGTIGVSPLLGATGEFRGELKKAEHSAWMATVRSPMDGIIFMFVLSGGERDALRRAAAHAPGIIEFADHDDIPTEHWSRACPVCGYDLVGLTEPRCPECAYLISHEWLDRINQPRTGSARLRDFSESDR